MRASVFTLTLLCPALYAESNDDLDVLRARSTEQRANCISRPNRESHVNLLRTPPHSGWENHIPPAVIPSQVDSDFIVSTGDTLSSIARKHQASVETS